MLCHSGEYAQALVCFSTIPQPEVRFVRLQSAVTFPSSIVLHSDLLDLGGETCGLALDMAASTRVRVTDVLATTTLNQNFGAAIAPQRNETRRKSGVGEQLLRRFREELAGGVRTQVRLKHVQA